MFPLALCVVAHIRKLQYTPLPETPRREGPVSFTSAVCDRRITICERRPSGEAWTLPCCLMVKPVTLPVPPVGKAPVCSKNHCADPALYLKRSSRPKCAYYPVCNPIYETDKLGSLHRRGSSQWTFREWAVCLKCDFQNWDSAFQEASVPMGGVRVLAMCELFILPKRSHSERPQAVRVGKGA